MLLGLLACTPNPPPGSPDDSGAPAPVEDSAEQVPGLEKDPSDSVFDPTVIHGIELSMDAAAWADIQGNPWAETWHEAEFRWVSGADGREVSLRGVGVRAFGAGSKIGTKPPLKISFDKYADGQDFRGLEQLKLDNSSQDPGFMNERIGTMVLRDFGLPAARTGWATVSVNGAAAGFFTVLEAIDDRFLERFYGEAEGPLFGMVSGYYSQGLNPFPAGYEDPFIWYDVQTSVESDGSELVEATRVIAGGSDEELAAILDLDEFTRMSVARSVIGGIDTFSADGNNFYLYSHEGRLSIIAWDLDADLGYPYAFSNALAVKLEAPWEASPWSVNPVTGAPYSDPVLKRHLAMGADLQAIADEFLAGAFDWAEVDAAIVESAALIRDAVYDDVLGYGSAFDVRIANLRLFVHVRSSALLGRDAAPCTEPADGGVWVSELAPSGTVGWGELLLDRTYWGPGFSVRGEHHCRGLFVHAPSEVKVSVPEGKGTLSGAVGLQDWNQQCGDGATFEIWQGGSRLWASDSLATYSAEEDIGDLAVAPGELRLVTLPNGEYSCDTTSWLDLRLR